ncbi:MAG: hypothetical protein ACE5GE_12885 [Phycisphaerae bacterium]
MIQEDLYRELNELIAAERRCLFHRLIESTVFVSASESADLEFVRRTAGEHEAHLGRLIETLIRLGGEPVPGRGDIHSADFHFVDMHILWPRVRAREQELADRFERAAARLDDWPEVLLLVREIAGRHRACAEYVGKWCGVGVSSFE